MPLELKLGDLKMSGYDSFKVSLSIVVMIVVSKIMSACVMADIPFSGGDFAITPYTEATEPNLAQVKKLKDQANEYRFIKEAKNQYMDTMLDLSQLGACPVK